MGDSGSEVLKALGHFETRARNLLLRLTQLADYLHLLQGNPNCSPDWANIVTHFKVSESQLEQLAKEIQPFLVHSVLRPSQKPPLGSDVPLMLSTRSHLEMETLETQLATEALDWPTSLEEVEALVASTNEAVSNISTVCDDQLDTFKEKLRAYKSPGMEEPAWKQGAAQRMEKAFANYEAMSAGRF